MCFCVCAFFTLRCPLAMATHPTHIGFTTGNRPLSLCDKHRRRCREGRWRPGAHSCTMNLSVTLRLPLAVLPHSHTHTQAGCQLWGPQRWKSAKMVSYPKYTNLHPMTVSLKVIKVPFSRSSFPAGTGTFCQLIICGHVDRMTTRNQVFLKACTTQTSRKIWVWTSRTWTNRSQQPAVKVPLLCNLNTEMCLIH